MPRISRAGTGGGGGTSAGGASSVGGTTVTASARLLYGTDDDDAWAKKSGPRSLAARILSVPVVRLLRRAAVIRAGLDGPVLHACERGVKQCLDGRGDQRLGVVLRRDADAVVGGVEVQ